jgi:hypothetical protein
VWGIKIEVVVELELTELEVVDMVLASFGRRNTVILWGIRARGSVFRVFLIGGKTVGLSLKNVIM